MKTYRVIMIDSNHCDEIIEAHCVVMDPDLLEFYEFCPETQDFEVIAAFYTQNIIGYEEINRGCKMAEEGIL